MIVRSRRRLAVRLGLVSITVCGLAHAAAAGDFEKGLAAVKARRYAPRPDGGVDRRVEIVDYTITDDDAGSD